MTLNCYTIDHLLAILCHGTHQGIATNQKYTSKTNKKKTIKKIILFKIVCVFSVCNIYQDFGNAIRFHNFVCKKKNYFYHFGGKSNKNASYSGFALLTQPPGTDLV